MPITDAVNTTGLKAFVYPVPVVLLGALGGARPTVSDASGSMIPTRIVRSAGGARLDFADLSFPLNASLVDRAQPADFTRVIDVRLSLAGDTWPTPTGPSLHLGDYVSETESVANDGESLTGQSQLRSYHFGSTLKGMLVWNKLKDANEWMHGEVLFNPAVDQKVLPNKSSKQRTGGSLNSFLWAHPELSQTTKSQTWQEQTLSSWSLLTAVQALCEACNENQTFVLNPETTELAVLTGAPALQDVRLEPGHYLPYYLDRLLPALGYNWFLRYLPDPDDVTKTKAKILFFKRFEGTQKKLYFQRPNSVLDLSQTNVNQYTVSRSIGDSVNEVEIFGDLIRREVTLPLYPMWPETDDSIAREDLDKSEPTSTYHSDKQLVWRAFGANESGDLTGFRADSHAAGDPPDLTSVFPVYIPHRRNIEEPISMHSTGFGTTARIPIRIEYSTDGGSTWQQCPESWGGKLFPDQIAVLFDADQPPEELMDAGDDARLRITGTVAGDSRVTGFAAKQTFAVNARNVRMVLNLPDKFIDRRKQTTGEYASKIVTTDVDDRDDTTAIQTYAAEIRDRNNGAELECEISIPGFHCGYYEIGDLITEIDGRDVSLNAASTTDPVPRYPQITEIRLEVTDKGPRTVLVLDRGDGQQT